MVQTQVGAKVACRDGWAGVLKRLVVDPGTQETTHLVIETTSLFPYDAVVPVECVLAVGHEAVFLDLSSSQLKAYRGWG